MDQDPLVDLENPWTRLASSVNRVSELHAQGEQANGVCEALEPREGEVLAQGSPGC